MNDTEYLLLNDEFKDLLQTYYDDLSNGDKPSTKVNDSVALNYIFDLCNSGFLFEYAENIIDSVGDGLASEVRKMLLSGGCSSELVVKIKEAFKDDLIDKLEYLELEAA